VFLGIENILDEDLEFLRANSKNARRENGKKTGNATLDAIDLIHKNKMYVVGGLIVGTRATRSSRSRRTWSSRRSTSTGRTSSTPRRTRGPR
jgi:hypothetical protein